MKTLKKQGFCLLLIVCTLVSVNYVPFGEDDFPRVFSVSEVGNSLETTKSDFQMSIKNSYKDYKRIFDSRPRG